MPVRPPCPTEGLSPLTSPVLSSTQSSWVSSSPDGRAVLRDFVRNLLPQRLLKQKLQSLTLISGSKAFQSHGERGHGGVLVALSSPGGRGKGWGATRGTIPSSLCPPVPPECRELVLQAALPILQELIQAGEEEDACIELLSSILEVLYQAQKVNQESFGRDQTPLSGVKHQLLARIRLYLPRGLWVPPSQQKRAQDGAKTSWFPPQRVSGGFPNIHMSGEGASRLRVTLT